MTHRVEVFPEQSYAREAARRISAALPERGVVVLTGGTTAARIYPELASADWSDLEVFFSDERSVPPDDDASNYGMTARLLGEALRSAQVHRIRGEDDPGVAAAAYEAEVQAALVAGIDLLLLGLGTDCHIAAIFPGYVLVEETARLCAPVERPDGMTGITLTPPALLAAREVIVIASGRSKAEAVGRSIGGDEDRRSCPARLLAQHDDVTFVLDEPAASRGA